MKKKTRTVARSAKTGRIVSRATAKRRPSTTVIETVSSSYAKGVTDALGMVAALMKRGIANRRSLAWLKPHVDRLRARTKGKR